MTSDEQAIANLIYNYAALVDAGRFDDVGVLFEHGDYRSGPTGVRGAAVAAQMRHFVRLYDDGTPRTKHVTTNVRIAFASAHDATAQSYFTVLQAAPGQTLGPICAGRYDDRFEKVDGSWRFADRCIVMELVGDLSHHLTRNVFG